MGRHRIRVCAAGALTLVIASGMIVTSAVADQRAVASAASLAVPSPGKGSQPTERRCGAGNGTMSRISTIRPRAFDEPGRPSTAFEALARELRDARGHATKLRSLRYEYWRTAPGDITFVGFGQKGVPRGSVSVRQGGESKFGLPAA